MGILRMLPVIATVILSSCSLVEDDISLGHPHIYGHRNNTRTGTPLQQDSSATDRPARPRKDTLTYLSAVRVPVDYDWQKDSAYGAVKAEIVLLRNYKEVLSIPVGPQVSAAADRHHIAGGHIFTEFQASSKTYLGMDGHELVTLEGRHELMGVLEHDGVLYTLTRPLGGSGFCLMADGQKILSKTGGQLYGSMSDPSYRPGGALYADGGSVCFCFNSGGSVFKVTDGVETMVRSSATGVQDIRIIDGNAVAATTSNGGYTWQEAKVWPLQDGHAISGIALRTPSVMRPNGSLKILLGSIESAIYVDDNQEFALDWSRDGTVRLAGSGMAKPLDGHWYFFSPKCATCGPEGPALALTPMGSTGKPVVMYGGETRTVGLNGFITGIEITIEEN